MSTNISIDWITATYKVGALPDNDFAGGGVGWALHILEMATERIGDIRFNWQFDPEVRAHDPRYPVQIQCMDTGITLAAPYRNSDKATVKLTMSGSATVDDRLALLRALQGWNITRLDIALDVFFQTWTVRDFKDAWLLSRLEKPDPRMWAYQESKSGSTLQIGSRQTDKMLRIYDKGAEQKMDMPWIRLELELKGKRAMGWAGALWRSRAKLVGLIHNFREAVGIDYSVFGKVWALVGASETSAFDLSVGRKETKTEIWLSGIVATTFEKLLTTDPDAARRVYQVWTDIFNGKNG